MVVFQSTHHMSGVLVGLRKVRGVKGFEICHSEVASTDFGAILRSTIWKRTRNFVNSLAAFSKNSECQYPLPLCPVLILVSRSLPMIPQLSLALSISSPHLAPDELDAFMRRMLISRISRRVLVEHHVALTQGLCERDDDPDAPKHVGIIYTNLSVKESIDKCIRFLKSEEGMYGLRRLEEPTLRGTGIWPEIIIDGHLDARFPYIKEHLEYIIFALLKNVRTV